MPDIPAARRDLEEAFVTHHYELHRRRIHPDLLRSWKALVDAYNANAQAQNARIDQLIREHSRHE